MISAPANVKTNRVICVILKNTKQWTLRKWLKIRKWLKNTKQWTLRKWLKIRKWLKNTKQWTLRKWLTSKC